MRPWNWHGHLYCRIVCAARRYHVYEAVWEWYIGEGCFSTRKSKLSLSSGEVAELFEMLTMFYDRLLLPAHINLTQP